MLKEQIVTEIMSLVRQPPKKLETPSIDDLEKILNSECTDAIHIEPDGSVSVTPTVTTVGAVADKVVLVVDVEINRLRKALTDIAQGNCPGALFDNLPDESQTGDKGIFQERLAGWSQRTAQMALDGH